MYGWIREMNMNEGIKKVMLVGISSIVGTEI